jgi:succinate dehydrogenase/fumarate reductase cytochrome b subunit
MELEERYSRLTHSYLDLRKTVGLIGIALPFVLMGGLRLFFNAEETPTSISHYYHTSMGDVFVGALCAVALFLFFYSGHDKKDDWLGNIAGFFAIGVAWFPTTKMAGDLDTTGIIHYTCAAIFFLCLAVFSLVLFTKTKTENGIKQEMSTQKKARNMIYKGCGIIILLCLVAIVLHKSFGIHASLVFWAETVALAAFGLSWLTKGEAFFTDKE